MKNSTFRVTDNQRKNMFNLAITKPKKDLDFDTYSFVQIIKTYYDLKPDLVDHMIWILKRLKSDYHSLCNGISEENMVIACALSAMECSKLPCYEDNDISGFVECIYKPARTLTCAEQQSCENRIKAEITQIYGLYHTIQDLFYDSSEEPVSEVDEVQRAFWKN